MTYSLKSRIYRIPSSYRGTVGLRPNVALSGRGATLPTQARSVLHVTPPQQRPALSGKRRVGRPIPATGQCKMCGVTYTFPKKELMRRAGFCSLRCWYDYRGKVALDKRGSICPQCGSGFLLPENTSHSFCSHRCLMESRGSFRICEGCKEEFQISPSVRRIYCSRECYLKYRPTKTLILVCDCCGGPLRKQSVYARRHKRHFCSKECFTKGTRGPGSPLWRGNRRHYRGNDWLEQAAKARERDGNKCCSCEVVSKEKASVDHIVAYRLAKDWAPALGISPNDLRNLICLCRRCHSKKTQGAEAALLKGDMAGFYRKIAPLNLDTERIRIALVLFGLERREGEGK